MRVAYINTVCGCTSTGKIIALLATNENYESKIYYGRRGYSGDLDTFKFNNIVGNSIHAISTFIFDNHGFSNKKQTEKLINDLKIYDPDIIHLHNLHGYYLNVEVLFDYLKLSRAKIVWTMHDCWPYTGHCAYYDCIDCNQWKDECKKCSITLHYPPSFNKHNVNVNFNRKKIVFTSLAECTFVTPSKWLKHEMEESFLSKYEIKVISNGIDLTVYKPSKDKSKDVIEILAVANVWTKEKGFNDLIEFSKLLNEKMHLTIVGVNNYQMKLFDNCKYVTCIKHTTNQQELVDCYSHANYFINFTYEDNFPTVNIESLACGTPVITYRTGGSVEIVNEESGIVIPKGGFKRCFELINTKPTFSREACVNSAHLYSRENMLKKYEELYFSLISR